MGKKKDIKYRLREEDIASLEELQKKILDTVWRYVKPGGLLLYSTCTVNRTENQEIVRWFAGTYGWKCEPVRALLERKLGTFRAGSGQMDSGMDEDHLPFLKECRTKGQSRDEWGLQLVPTVYNDGFFIAGLRRPN